MHPLPLDGGGILSRCRGSAPRTGGPPGENSEFRNAQGFRRDADRLISTDALNRKSIQNLDKTQAKKLILGGGAPTCIRLRLGELKATRDAELGCSLGCAILRQGLVVGFIEKRDDVHELTDAHVLGQVWHEGLDPALLFRFGKDVFVLLGDDVLRIGDGGDDIFRLLDETQHAGEREFKPAGGLEIAKVHIGYGVALDAIQFDEGLAASLRITSRKTEPIFSGFRCKKPREA